MRVLITGGTGFIGRHLASSLISDDHEVIILSRDPTRAKPVAGAKAVAWDGKSADGWGELADGAGAIVNLAGESIGGGRWTDSRRKAIVESRVNAGRAVMQAIDAAKVKPGVLIQSSAVGYYGPRGDELVTEKASPGTDFLSRVVWDWESSTAGAQRMGVRRVVLRTGLVFGLDGGSLPLMLLPFRFYVAGGPLGSGKQYVPWIHLADEIGAIRFLMANEQASGAFNLSSPNPVTYKEFASTVGEVMGRPSFMPAPSFAIKAVLGDMSTLVLTGQRQIPERLLEMGYVFQFPELEPALRDILKK